MTTYLPASARTYAVALRMLLLCTAALGVGYTLLVTGVGAAAFNHNAHGGVIAS